MLVTAMKKIPPLSFAYWILTVLCGIVVALFRMKSGVSSGLLIVGAAAALVLCAAAFLTQRFFQKHSIPQAEPNRLTFAMIACAGFLFLGAALLFFVKGSGSSLLRAVMAVFSAITGVASLMRLSQRDKTELAAGYSLIPVFWVGFYLLMLYRGNGDNPYLAQFGCEIAVFLLVLIGIYASVAGWFLKPRPSLRRVGMSWGLAACVQELVFFALRPADILSVRSMSLGTIVLLAACGCLLSAALLAPPQLFPEPVESESTDQSDMNISEE